VRCELPCITMEKDSQTATEMELPAISYSVSVELHCKAGE